MELTAVLTPAEEGGYIALNPETGSTTQGESVEEAVANLKEATALYLSEFPLPRRCNGVSTDSRHQTAIRSNASRAMTIGMPQQSSPDVAPGMGVCNCLPRHR